MGLKKLKLAEDGLRQCLLVQDEDPSHCSKQGNMLVTPNPMFYRQAAPVVGPLIL